MDIATIVGLIALVTAIMVGIGSNLHLFVDPPSLIMVLGGTLALTMIALPLHGVVGLFGVITRVLVTHLTVPTVLIESAVRMAERARGEGILSLEEEVHTGDHDVFLKSGVMLAVDGTEPDLIMDIMETELQFIERRHAAAADAMSMIARNGLVAGGVATLIGTIIWTADGPGIADIGGLAILPVFYGLAVWGVMRAIEHKLRTYAAQEKLTKQLAIEAVMSIQCGDNPRIVEHKLSVFLQPAMRPSGPPPSDEDQPTPVFEKDPQLVAAVAQRVDSQPDTPFRFDDLARLSDPDIQVLLRAVDQKDLVLALLAAHDEVSEKLLSGMSGRVRDFITEELAFTSDPDADLIADRQAAIAQQAQNMARDGKIQLPE